MQQIVHLQKTETLVNIITQNPKKLVIIDFHAAWCRPCKFIEQKFDQEWIPMYKDKFILVKVDTDDDNLESLSTQYKVKGIPRLIFYYDKKIVDDVTGAQTDVIANILGVYCK